jgi:hypothetical protein
MLSNKISALVLAAGISIGLIAGSAILGRAIEASRNSDRFVTVRGLAEKDVTADLAIWPIKVRTAGNNLNEANRSADEARGKVLEFLEKNGIPADAVASQNVRVQDRQANDYNQNNNALRFIVEYTILIRSKDVEKVQKVSQMTDQLVAAGIVLSSQGGWDGNSPQFLFTQLNAVKPAMMADATKAAREAARQFAADSDSAVGTIRRASQGLFTIADRDQSAGGEGNGGGQASAPSPNKRIRVVVTIDYFLN